MAAGSVQLYNDGMVPAFFDGSWKDDDHYAILVGTGYTFDASHATLADVSAEELTDTDYDPQDLTGESTSESAGVVTHDADEVDFGDPVTINNADGIIVLMGTVAGKSSSDTVVGYMSLGDESASGGAFKVDWHDTDGLVQWKDCSGVWFSGKTARVYE